VEYVGGVSSVEVYCVAIELGDRQQVDLIGGDDAGHRLAAPQTPEEVDVFVGGDAEHLARPGHQYERPHVVGGQPDGAHQRADAAAGQVAKRRPLRAPSRTAAPDRAVWPRRAPFAT
jgi:hypothetical protein